MLQNSIITEIISILYDQVSLHCELEHGLFLALDFVGFSTDMNTFWNGYILYRYTIIFKESSEWISTSRDRKWKYQQISAKLMYQVFAVHKLW
jgi:hypothetical protein